METKADDTFSECQATGKGGAAAEPAAPAAAAAFGETQASPPGQAKLTAYVGRDGSGGGEVKVGPACVRGWNLSTNGHRPVI